MKKITPNLIAVTHQFLMNRCDGAHADRFLLSLRNTPYDPSTQTGSDMFNRLNEEEQIIYCVEYWADQALRCGYASNKESIDHMVSIAVANFNDYMETILNLIVEENLPICTC